VKRKLKIVVPLVLVILGGTYKFVLAKPPEEHKKIHGQVYVLPKEFVVNLADGRFAKLGVGLVLAHDQPIAPEGHAPAKPPEGFGTLEQEALVREIVTDALTDQRASHLVDRRERRELKERILKEILRRTDVKTEEVVFTDIAVQ
jgi:flagellar basal body-associated protein FliL